MEQAEAGEIPVGDAIQKIREIADWGCLIGCLED